MKTPNVSEKEITRKWYLFDATDAVVGRMASRVAAMLRGKHKTNFVPHLDLGDFVVEIGRAHV